MKKNVYLRTSIKFATKTTSCYYCEVELKTTYKLKTKTNTKLKHVCHNNYDRQAKQIKKKQIIC